MSITYKDLSQNGPVEDCRELCNALMAHQAEHGIIGKNVLASMTFDNRLKPNFDNAKQRFLYVAYDGNKPVGYVFCEASHIESREKLLELNKRPEWAESFPQGLAGLYPDNMPVPTVVAHLNNLYVNPNYRGLNIGKELMNAAINWLKAVPGVKHLFVHVSNGNNPGALYEKYGFRYDYDVWGGFIKCYRMDL